MSTLLVLIAALAAFKTLIDSLSRPAPRPARPKSKSVPTKNSAEEKPTPAKRVSLSSAGRTRLGKGTKH